MQFLHITRYTIQAGPLLIHGLADTNVPLQNTVNLIQAMESVDNPFYFVPLPNEDHHYEGDELVTCLSASADYFARYLGNPQAGAGVPVAIESPDRMVRV